MNTPKKRPHKGLVAALCVLLVLCALSAGDGARALGRFAYPQRYSEYVTYYAQKYEIDPNIVYSIIRTESGFDPAAQSDAGARGLMQMTEDTFDWVKTKIAPTEAVGFDDLYDPETSVRFGTYLLAVCLARYGGDLSTAAAAYHSGIGQVDALLEDARYSSDGQTLFSFPYRQMNHYVNKVNASYQRYCSLYGEP